mmetsp:Transcript_6802/g.15779  ORF Transcript_6802/g.15779 Transcript_6802/m.15779 type:complete len:202 (-) Transcript_6802:2555-3160(-)
MLGTPPPPPPVLHRHRDDRLVRRREHARDPRDEFRHRPRPDALPHLEGPQRACRRAHLDREGRVPFERLLGPRHVAPLVLEPALAREVPVVLEGEALPRLLHRAGAVAPRGARPRAAAQQLRPRGVPRAPRGVARAAHARVHLARRAALGRRAEPEVVAELDRPIRRIRGVLGRVARPVAHVADVRHAVREERPSRSGGDA